MIRRLLLVVCDTCGTPAGGPEVAAESLRAARAVSRLRGFVHAGGKHICPACIGTKTGASS